MELGEQRRFCIAGLLKNVRRLALFCRRTCEKYFSPEDLDSIELAVVEATNNIIKHAYGGESKNPVEIGVTRHKGFFRIRIYDHGKPFNPEAIPSPNFEWAGIDKIPESGRGLYIIRNIMDNVSFSREKSLNMLTMEKYSSITCGDADYEELAPSIWYEKVAESVQTHREMESAVKLHNSIIPKNAPVVPGLILFSKSESAFETGGDYITFYQQDDSTLWFFVGDAMGKGMSAAIFTLLMHMVIKSIIKTSAPDKPGILLSITNRIMSDDFDRFGMFITALAGKVDMKKNILSYSSAGHCPPIISSDNKHIDILDTQDFMMGVDPSVEYHTYNLPFTKGMRFLAYTDGITDITNSRGEMLGVEPLLYACASEFKNKNVDEACTKIFSEALIATGGRLQDDISMLAVQRT
ncbi:MAG: hypothetical protein A2020_08385 [Lentisphaerae bacterium GWF2_45_14]|nr:MAG: hypothetical protein A2020_08385 [Lentisphaerae bacterium GWF2_45_14]